MTPIEYLKKFLPEAAKTEKKTGWNALAVLAQGAVESGWGEKCPGYAMFGVKDYDGKNGNEQLLPTFEIVSNPNLSPQQVGLVDITKITPIVINGKKFFQYSGHYYFRKYNSFAESFEHHIQILENTKINGKYIYAEAIKYKNDPYRLIDEIAKAGYAQSPTYAETIKSIIKTLIKVINNNKTTFDYYDVSKYL